MGADVWIAYGAVAVAAVALAAGIPAVLKDARRRQARGAGGSLAGLGSGFDAVWRPSAEDARAQWEAQIEVPAPAPVPGDKGRMQDGRITIEVTD